jgi:CheY-like chemotaxis protein
VESLSHYKNALSGKAALIIEDNILNQLIARKSLDYVAMKYKIIDNGDDAIDVFLANHFDIILLDINIPGINGFEIASNIRQLDIYNKKKVPIIAVTGSDINDIFDKIKISGINDCLLKPYTQEQLYEIILKSFQEMT